MKANYENKNNPSPEITLGNIYDINKQLMEQEPGITEAELQLAKEHLRTWFTHNFNQKYFMMLCHELRDYTVFNLDKTDSWKMAKPQTIMSVANDVIECMQNRGTLIMIDEQDANSWELWIRNDEGCFVYYLFPYGTAVLEY